MSACFSLYLPNLGHIAVPCNSGFPMPASLISLPARPTLELRCSRSSSSPDAHCCTWSVSPTAPECWWRGLTPQATKQKGSKTAAHLSWGYRFNWKLRPTKASKFLFTAPAEARWAASKQHRRSPHLLWFEQYQPEEGNHTVQATSNAINTSVLSPIALVDAFALPNRWPTRHAGRPLWWAIH